ncbi:MAG: hypothetical protein RI519_04840 [Balneolaceae bacterium]|nr:hypothetical protein [Balneolaceae bacterium]
MKRVGLIAPFFPPLQRVGALRPGRWATYLSDYGWEPWVVTLAAPGEGGQPSSLDSRQIYSLHHLQSSGERKGDPSFGGVRSWLDSRVPYDGFWPIFRLNERRIIAWLRDVAQVECLVSTGDPWSAHWIASKVAPVLGVPWVADFRDPWTLSRVSLRARSKGALSADANREAKVIQKADALTFTSETACKRYQEAYPLQASRMSVIHNSSGIVDKEVDLPHLDVKSEITLLFFGSFRRLSPIEPWRSLFHHVSHLAQEKAVELPKVKVISANATVEPFEELSWLEHQTFSTVEPSHAVSMLNDATVLLLSTHPDRDDIIPAKLWDYIAASPPILSLGSSEDVGGILEATGRGVQFDARHDDESMQAAQWLLDRILAGRESLRSGYQDSAHQSTLSQQWKHSIHPKTMTSKLSALLDSLLDPPPMHDTLSKEPKDMERHE